MHINVNTIIYECVYMSLNICEYKNKILVVLNSVIAEEVVKFIVAWPRHFAYAFILLIAVLTKIHFICILVEGYWYTGVMFRMCACFQEIACPISDYGNSNFRHRAT